MSRAEYISRRDAPVVPVFFVPEEEIGAKFSGTASDRVNQLGIAGHMTPPKKAEVSERKFHLDPPEGGASSKVAAVAKGADLK